MKQPVYLSAVQRHPVLFPMFFAASAACITLTGCAAGSNDKATANAAPATSTSTPSYAYLGSLAGSNVSAFAFDKTGTIGGTALARTTTDNQGFFSIPQQSLLVEVGGGSYKEEATGDYTALTGDTLRAAYLTAPSTLVVSPFTEAVVVDAQATGDLSESNLTNAAAKVQKFLKGADPLSTVPSTVSPGASVTTPSPGNWMAFALGVESQMRTTYKIDHASAVQAIVAQAENGDTMLNCNGGAGNLALDGTLAAPQGDNCAFTQAAARYVKNPLNNSGITALPVMKPTLASPTQYATVTPSSCGDRIALLQSNMDLFNGRKDDVQAQLIDSDKEAITLDNWKTTANAGKWGPSKSVYGPITVPDTCTDVNQFRRELVMAIENYWIDHGLNYCHHHIPGWTPPDDSDKKNPYYRNSSDGSTSGGSTSGMTCTAQRSRTGAQKASTSDAFSSKDIQWQGADCSNFTAWTYDFAGIATGQLPGDIASQACSVDTSVPGKLFDINSKNISTMIGYLQPGDLLLVTQTGQVTGSDSLLDGSGSTGKTYKEAHVITWTGKRWSDLQKGADKDKYDLSKLGQPGSRLGGDLSKKYLGYEPSLLGSDDAHDPWMIVDSHFAGPAYRPFVPADEKNGITANWYAADLSAVRRIVGAAEAAASQSPLASYVMNKISPDTDTLQIIASAASGASLASGDRLLFQTEGKSTGCQRVVTP